MSFYVDLYQAAVNQDEKQLRKTIYSANKDDINEIVTVVKQLLSEGNHSAVDFLITRGIGINVAVRSYAKTGNRDRVLELIKLGASKDWAVEGAVQGVHQALVSELIELGASKDQAVEFVARGGHKAWVSELIKQGASLDMAVMGAATMGHQAWVSELILQGASKDYAVRGAAYGGHRNWVEELIRQGASKDHAVRGAAFGGHQNWVEELIKQGASCNYAQIGADEGGQHDLKKWLFDHCDYLKREELVTGLKVRALPNQPDWEKDLTKLARLHTEGSRAALTEVGNAHAEIADELIKRKGIEHVETTAALNLLHQLAEWRVPLAVKYLDVHQRNKAHALLQAALNRDVKALAELEKMATTVAIAQLCLGHYHFKQIKEPIATATIFSIFKPTPLEFAMRTFTKALSQDLIEAHYYLGECHEKKNQLFEALDQYFLASKAGVMTEQVQQKIKILSHHSNAAVAVAANLYLWFLNSDQQFLEVAIAQSAEQVALFAVKQRANASLSSRQRLHLLLSVMTHSLSAHILKTIHKAIYDTIWDERKYCTAEKAYEIARDVNQVLKEHSEARVSLVMYLLKTWLYHSQIVPGALLHFEMRELHNPELQTKLAIYWAHISNDIKAEFEKLDVTLYNKKNESLNLEVTSSTATCSTSNINSSSHKVETSSTSTAAFIYPSAGDPLVVGAATIGIFKVANTLSVANENAATQGTGAPAQNAMTNSPLGQDAIQVLAALPIAEDELDDNEPTLASQGYAQVV